MPRFSLGREGIRRNIQMWYEINFCIKMLPRSLPRVPQWWDHTERGGVCISEIWLGPGAAAAYAALGTLLKVSEPRGQCHIALENMGVIFKNLLILISNIITDPVWFQYLCVSRSDMSNSIIHQDPLSTGFFRQEYWSGLPFPPPGDLPNSETESKSPTLQTDSIPLDHEMFAHCFMSLDMFQCLLVYNLWEPE